MMRPRLTGDLTQALAQLVAAHWRLRKAACGGDRYEAVVVQFDKAAEAVVREACAAGFKREGEG